MPTRPGTAVARWRAPGTCGELVQGCIDGADFLINCPIDLFSRATVHVGPRPAARAGVRGLDKVGAALDLMRVHASLPPAHQVRVQSDIPRGKGMGSSTADITAALSAYCEAARHSLDPSEFGRLIARVEPSDCVHYPGIACVNQLTGRLLQAWPVPPGLRVLVLDCGGQLDTLAFDRVRARAVYAARRTEVRHMLDLAGAGLRARDLGAVARAATLSARLSQHILFKAPLEPLLAASLARGALGVNCAHSGTVLGVLYRGSDALGSTLRVLVERDFAGQLTVLGDHEVIGGGAGPVRRVQPTPTAGSTCETPPQARGGVARAGS